MTAQEAVLSLIGQNKTMALLSTKPDATKTDLWLAQRSTDWLLNKDGGLEALLKVAGCPVEVELDNCRKYVAHLLGGQAICKFVKSFEEAQAELKAHFGI